MAALDRVKEEIGYLKLWQGIVVVTFISSGGRPAPAKLGNVIMDRETLSAIVAFLAIVFICAIALDVGRDKDKK